MGFGSGETLSFCGFSANPDGRTRRSFPHPLIVGDYDLTDGSILNLASSPKKSLEYTLSLFELEGGATEGLRSLGKRHQALSESVFDFLNNSIQ